MKKLIITICLGIILLVTPVAIAEETMVDNTEDWGIMKLKDDFTDKVTYFLGTKNALRYGCPGIAIYFANNTENILLFINSKITGMGITYRVDKRPAITLKGIQAGEDVYFINRKGLNKLIKDFKEGKAVVYKIHSSNQFIDDETERISLMGFSKLYDKVNKLANKGE